MMSRSDIERALDLNHHLLLSGEDRIMEVKPVYGYLFDVEVVIEVIPFVEDTDLKPELRYYNLGTMDARGVMSEVEFWFGW